MTNLSPTALRIGPDIGYRVDVGDAIRRYQKRRSHHPFGNGESTSGFLRIFGDDSADGIKTGSQWGKAHIGMLVRDFGRSPKAKKCSKYDQKRYEKRSNQWPSTGRIRHDFLEKNHARLTNPMSRGFAHG